MRKEKGHIPRDPLGKKRIVRIILVIMIFAILSGAAVTAATVGSKSSSGEANGGLTQLLNYDQAVSKVKQSQNAWYYFHVRVGTASDANGLIAIQLLFENMDSGIYELYMYDHRQGYFYDMYIPMNTKNFGKLVGIRVFNESTGKYTIDTIDVMPVEPGVRIPCWRFGLSEELRINQKSYKTFTNFTETNATRLAVKIKGVDSAYGRFLSADSNLTLNISYRKDSDNRSAEMTFDVNKYVSVQQANDNYKLFSTEGKEEIFHIIVYDFSYIQWMTLNYSGQAQWHFDSLKYDIIEYTFKGGDDSISLSEGYTYADYVMEMNKQFITRFCKVQNSNFLTYGPGYDIALDSLDSTGHFNSLMFTTALLSEADRAAYADSNEYADTVNKVVLKGSVTEIEYAEAIPDEETVHLVDFYLISNSDEKYEDSLLLRYYWNSSLSGLSFDETVEMKNYMQINGRQVLYSRNHEIKDMESLYRVAVSYSGDDLPGAEYVVIQVRNEADGERKCYWADFEGNYFTEMLYASLETSPPDRGINYAEVSFKSNVTRDLTKNDLNVSITYTEYFSGETVTEIVSLESVGMTLLKKGETYDIKVPIGLYKNITTVEFESEKVFELEDLLSDTALEEMTDKLKDQPALNNSGNTEENTRDTSENGAIADAYEIEGSLEIATLPFCDIIDIKIFPNFSNEAVETFKSFETVRTNDKSIRLKIK